MSDRLKEPLAALYQRAPLGMRLGLEPMRAVCNESGNPERAFEALHVAGTNGKGSVSAMTESIVRAAGKKTGLYTSPHLCRFAERIRINGAPISDDALADALSRALTAGPDLSFFETATLAAFFAFREAKVDLAVLEVGIGGRLDATNVIEKPLVTAVTSIGLDHMEMLGDTIEKIALEKAAIAKPGAPMVLGAMPEEARAAIVRYTESVGARVVDARGASPVLPSLPGAFQRPNADVAWAIATELRYSTDVKEWGLAQVNWPGRFERIDHEDRVYILDGAHNPDGARVFRASVEAMKRDPAGVPWWNHALPFPPGPRTALIFGALADKAWREVIDLLAPLASDEECRVYVTPKGRAPAPPSEIASRHAGKTAGSVKDALAMARDGAGANGLVLVTGSLYLVGEARAALLGLPMDPPVAL